MPDYQLLHKPACCPGACTVHTYVHTVSYIHTYIQYVQYNILMSLSEEKPEQIMSDTHKVMFAIRSKLASSSTVATHWQQSLTEGLNTNELQFVSQNTIL